jgi:hypothetical protein
MALVKRTGALRVMYALPVLLVTGWMVVSGYSTIRSIFRNNDQGYFQFARYLNETISPDTVVESWEWELDLVTKLRYHHPPTWVTNAATRRLWVDGLGSKVAYDFRQFAPEYVVVGPFARWTGLYADAGLLEDADLQVSIGRYDLY